MATTLEIIQGISQAVANKHDGARDDKGELQSIGLRREKETPVTDKRIMDGFGVSINGNILKVNYHSEISLKEVYEKKFEEEISGILEDCVSFIKKEYKRNTKNTLELKKVDDAVVRVEHMNKVRSWVTAYCLYEIKGIKSPKDETYEDRMKDVDSYWKKFDKKK